MNLQSLITGRLAALVARRAKGRGSARRAAATAVFAGAAAFGAIHFGLAGAAARVPLIFDPLYADKEERLAELERAAPGTPLALALGSSRVLNGFAAGRVGPAAAASGTPAVAFNFGVPGAGPIAQAVYLRRLLAAGHAPAVVLLEVMPSQLTNIYGFPRESTLLLADRLTRAETDLLVERYAFPGEPFRARRSEADYWPWGAHRSKVLSRLEPDAVPGESRTDAGTAADAHGWLGLMANITPTPPAFARAAATYRDALEDWRPGPAPVLALRDCLSMCRARGITVALVLMPEASAFRALCPAPARERLNAFLADTGAEFGCPVVDAREWVIDDGFADGHHLLRAPAVAFTDRLTAEVVLPLLRSAAGRRGAP